VILRALTQATGAKPPAHLPVMRDPRLLESAYHLRMRRGPVDDARDLLVARLDDGEDPSDAVEPARRAHRSKWTEAAIAASVIGGIFTAVSTYHAAQLNRVLSAFLKLDLALVGNEIGLAADLAAVVRDNVALIRSLPDTFYDAITESITARAADGTLNALTLAGELEDAYGITDRRAALIAQDQVQKFFGRLNQQRQQALGIERYDWITQLDERVRHGHAKRHETTWSWAEEPPDVGGGPGHPGIPVRCRCVARPRFDGVSSS
jgi:SPP1 gp7 family putative phage head morphogenesis protein